ncbi:hypothetical protein OROHE_004245 [Orobanche hederae]
MPTDGYTAQWRFIEDTVRSSGWRRTTGRLQIKGIGLSCCEDGVRHSGMTNATRNSSDTSPDVVRGVVGLSFEFTSSVAC